MGGVGFFAFLDFGVRVGVGKGLWDLRINFRQRGKEELTEMILLDIKFFFRDFVRGREDRGKGRLGGWIEMLEIQQLRAVRGWGAAWVKDEEKD